MNELLNRNPLVSVIIPSYNHENFIRESINSVLIQGFTDLEIIIVDDCSQDSSVEVIRSFDDARIRFFQNTENQGAVYTTNLAISYATGKYVALLNSDDVWLPNKLEQQFQFLESHPEVGAVFSRAQFVDESGTVLNKLTFFWADVFDHDNRSSALWLRRFFFKFNCLCHPSILIRREIYQKYPLYEASLRQLPDFAMWVVYIIKTKNL